MREFCELAFRVADVELEWEGEGIEEVGRDRANGMVRVEVNPKHFRPAEVETLLADPTRVKTELGWEPKVSFPELVQMMVRHDLNEVSRS